MIRILYVVDSLMAGGIESQLVELVTHLDRARFEPVVLCLYGPKVRDLHFAPQLDAADVSYYTLDLGWSAWDKVKGVACIASVARRVRPQIIQTEGYHANLLTRLAWPFLPRATLIGSVRGLHTTKQLLYERLSHWMCARMVVNAAHLKTMLVTRAHIPASKMLVIPNGIDLSRFAHPHDSTLRQHIAPHARRVFVSLGRISFEKNMHWLAEAMGLLKQQGRLPADVHFFLVGSVQNADAQQVLEAVIRRDALADYITQHQSTNHPEDYYYACDACILFSPAEGLPNVCIEALAAGRPTLISEAANAAGVIEHGVTGWVARTGDIAHLADVLFQIICLPEAVFSQMREACLRAAQAYRADLMAQRYMNLYEVSLPSPGVVYALQEG